MADGHSDAIREDRHDLWDEFRLQTSKTVRALCDKAVAQCVGSNRNSPCASRSRIIRLRLAARSVDQRWRQWLAGKRHDDAGKESLARGASRRVVLIHRDTLGTYVPATVEITDRKNQHAKKTTREGQNFGCLYLAARGRLRYQRIRGMVPGSRPWHGTADRGGEYACGSRWTHNYQVWLILRED